jgi:tRNA C32,U32 (ribose-2'-O)-methylase TrmJ
VTQSATIALRTLNRQTREEDIEKTIEEYRYEENISKEIDSIIADINFNKEDEKELEAELTQLVHISQPESEEIVKLLENLPTVKNKDKQKKKKKETVPLI